MENLNRYALRPRNAVVAASSAAAAGAAAAGMAGAGEEQHQQFDDGFDAFGGEWWDRGRGQMLYAGAGEEQQASTPLVVSDGVGCRCCIGAALHD